MKVCILGNGLTGLALAKALVNQGIYVDLFINKKINNKDKSRTLGISKDNVKFFNQNILDIKKLLWNINKIEIYSENLRDEKLLNFEDYKESLFSIVKNHELYNYLFLELKKNELIKIKKYTSYKNILQKYKLIINCDSNNQITKKFFYKNLNKNYNSLAYATIMKHRSLKNYTASQIFTKNGPLAFLPISKKETSIVYSFSGKKNINLENYIKKHNTKYKDIKINKVSFFELKSFNLRSYYYENILAFGDMLHKLHPLAGQGFNMSIRDIKVIVKLIKNKINLGLDLDKSICLEFENETRHRNYLFSSGIDFMFEFFNLERKFKNKILSRSVQYLGNKKYLNNLFIKFADNGIVI